MLEEEFLAVDYSPGNVFQSPRSVFIGLDVVLCCLLFFSQRRPTQRRQIQKFDNLGIRLSAGHPLMHVPCIRPQFVVYRRPVNQLKGLRQIAVRGSLTLTGKLSLRLTKDL